MQVLALSLGRSILERQSRERERMRSYAKALESYHLIILTRREHGFMSEMHEGNLHIYPTNSRSRFMMLVDAFFIAKRISLKAPAVVTAQDPFAIGFMSFIIARAKHARFHVQLHGDYFGSKYWDYGSVMRPFKLLLARQIMKRASGIRVVSERIKKSLIASGVSEAYITVLPIRPKLERFIATPRTSKIGSPLTFLIMSRFSPEKNIPLMLRAFAQVHGNHPNTYLRIVGKGNEEKRIRSMVSALGIDESVTIISWTEHPEEEYANADVFLLASDHEAYGLTLVEALATGLPIITTDVGCVGEVVKGNVHGIVVSPRDERAYVAAIERMVMDSNFRSASGRAGRETARMLSEQTEQHYIKTWVASLSPVSEAV